MNQPEQLDEQAILQQAIADLDPQVPIRSWERDGRVLILYLADGRELHYDWQSSEAIQDTHQKEPRDYLPEGSLAGYLKSDLQMVAQELGVEGWRDMLKAELVQALEDLRGN